MTNVDYGTQAVYVFHDGNTSVLDKATYDPLYMLILVHMEKPQDDMIWR